MIIGLTGPAGSGKDTVADWLEAAHDFHRIALADPIRRGLSAMLGISPKAFAPGIKEQPIGWLGKSPRELMQTLGTEWGRRLVADDIWLRIAERRIERLQKRTTFGLVITDIRFTNEAAWVREIGGSILHTHRQAIDEVRPHISEAGIEFKAGDVRLYNDGTIDDLHNLIDLLMLDM